VKFLARFQKKIGKGNLLLLHLQTTESTADSASLSTLLVTTNVLTALLHIRNGYDNLIL